MIVSVNCGPSCPAPPIPSKRMFSRLSGVASAFEFASAGPPKTSRWRLEKTKKLPTSLRTVVPRVADRYEALAPIAAMQPTKRVNPIATRMVARRAFVSTVECKKLILSMRMMVV